MERRKQIRFPVRFRSSFSSANLVVGDGTLHDLSLMGCSVLSASEVKVGTVLKLQVYTSDDAVPIPIAQAVVRWLRGKSFGCEFQTLDSEGWVRLQQVISNLEKQPYERASDETDAA